MGCRPTRSPIPVRTAMRMQAHDESRAATQLDDGDISSDLKTLQEACFSADTMVHVPGGYIEFFQLRVGDLVLSRHEETGEEAFRAIKQIHVTPHVKTVDLEFVDKNGYSAEPISTTEGHPFWVLGKGWTQVRDLREGDSISIAGSESVTFSSIVPGILGVCNVYNIEVETFHTYFVGAEGLWVHNCDGTGGRHRFRETGTASVRVMPGQ